MKKILSFALAICLVLSLSVVAFAVTGSPESSPQLPPPVASTPGAAAAGKYVFSVTTSSGLPLNASVDTLTSGSYYDEVKALGDVVGVYNITITSAVADTEIVNIDVYAPGATAGSAVYVRDAWEVLPGVTLAVNGNRAVITAPAGVINTWHYVAIVNNAKVVDVNNPQQDTENNEENEDVNDNDAPEVDVNDGEDTTPEANAPADDENPGTGVALAVVPMLVAAAAAVVSKRR